MFDKLRFDAFIAFTATVAIVAQVIAIALVAQGSCDSFLGMMLSLLVDVVSALTVLLPALLRRLFGHPLSATTWRIIIVAVVACVIPPSLDSLLQNKVSVHCVA